jgi:nucleotide-binding universal stress UspA family protein
MSSPTADVTRGAPLLVCYDGSEGGQAAVATAAALFPAHEAVVACYWQPFATSTTRFSIDLLELVQDPDVINEREEQLARETAERGADAAVGAGLVARGLAVRIEGPIDEAILSHADELDAVAIVLGSRSHSSLRSLILGDVANEVVQRASRPVVVTPSPDLARRRRDVGAAPAADD